MLESCISYPIERRPKDADPNNNVKKIAKIIFLGLYLHLLYKRSPMGKNVSRCVKESALKRF